MNDTHDTCSNGKGLARLCAGALLLLVGACAGERTAENLPDTPPAGIALGNEITLLDMATEKVVAHMAQDGRVHLVAVSNAGDALHLVVSERGIEERNTVGNGRHKYYEHLAITDDAEGGIHLAIKDEHWVWDKGAWRLAGSNRCALLARAADSVACVTETDGKGHWGITFFGGFGAGIPIPYRVRPGKIVVAEATADGWSYRNVLDYDLRYNVNLDNVGEAVLSGDAAGRLHVFFQAYEDNRFYYRYAALEPAEYAKRDIESHQSDAQTGRLTNSESQAVMPGPQWFIPASPPLPFAVDPRTGNALFMVRRENSGSRVDAAMEIHGKRLGQPVPFPVPGSRPKRLAPAGDNQFHALLVVDRSLIYAAYGAGAWSALAKVSGAFGTPSLFLIDDASVQLASDGRRQALAIWPKQQGVLAGRWIRLDAGEGRSL